MKKIVLIFLLLVSFNLNAKNLMFEDYAWPEEVMEHATVTLGHKQYVWTSDAPTNYYYAEVNRNLPGAVADYLNSVLFDDDTRIVGYIGGRPWIYDDPIGRPWIYDDPMLYWPFGGKWNASYHQLQEFIGETYDLEIVGIHYRGGEWWMLIRSPGVEAVRESFGYEPWSEEEGLIWIPIGFQKTSPPIFS